MYKIVDKRLLSPQIYLMEIEAPRVAKAAKPSQFLIIKIDEKGERIPLTICDYNSEAGTVTIVFQTLGKSTMHMAQFDIGDHFSDLVGPLGQPSELTELSSQELRNKKIIFIAGGVGTAPVYPQVKWLHEMGASPDVIVGTRSKETLILEEEMRSVAKELFITTDDGSYGTKGLVTEKLKELVLNAQKNYDLVIAIGPMIMMKFVTILTKELGIHTIVSLNPIMVDGTGMCGACRVTVGDEIKFACVDGPEFDGHRIDFDEAMRRQAMYKTEEGRMKLEELEGETHHSKGCNCDN